MKKTRTLIVMVFFIATLIAKSQTASAEITTSTYAALNPLRISVGEVIKYVRDLGRTVISEPVLQSDGCTYKCRTTDHVAIYETKIYTNLVSIVGYEDISL